MSSMTALLTVMLALSMAQVHSRTLGSESRQLQGYNTTSRRFEGEGTAFSGTIDSEEASQMACSLQYVNDWVADHFVAMNAEMWNGGKNCNRCVKVSCVDEDCDSEYKDVVMMVIDRCDPCTHGDLDMSTNMFARITGLHWDRKKISWKWSTCSPYIDGPIRMDPKDDSNRYWAAFYFSNLKYRLQSVSINGTPLKQDEFNFWYTNEDVGDGPYTLVLKTYPISATTTLTVRATINTLDESLTLPQFSTDGVSVASAE